LRASRRREKLPGQLWYFEKKEPSATVNDGFNGASPAAAYCS
jgi:hypothetical protein